MQLDSVPADQIPSVRRLGLERYCAVAIAAMDRQRLSTSEVAAALGIDRSHLGKIRRNERPMPSRILDDLIAHLALDRVRLVLAVELMENADLYFDPMFRNVCYYVQGVLGNLVALMDQSGSIDRKLMFASLSRELCYNLARSANCAIGDQFEALERFAG